MANVTRTTTWSDGQVLTAAALNGEFNNLLNALNIVNSDIAGGAAIAYSKLALSGSIVNADISSGAAIAYSKLNLSGSIQNSDLAGSISYSKLSLSGSIVDSDISNSANINVSKIANTAMDLSTVQTASNKTFTKPTLQASIQNITTDADAGTVTFNMATANVHTVTIAANRTFAVSNTTAGQAFVIRIIQGGSGSNVVTWFSTIHWPGGSSPTLTTTVGHWDVLAFLCTSAGVYDGYVIGVNLS